MSSDDYTYLLFDKAVDNDHGYNNKITKDISIENMFSSNYEYFEGMQTILEFNKFGGIYEIPKDLNLELFHPYMFYYSNLGVNLKITIIAVNKKVLENYVINKIHIPNNNFLIMLCNYHILYNKISSGINILDKSSYDTVINNTITQIIKTSMIPNADPIDPIEQQPTFNKIQLYNYQKQTIKWMLTREQEQKCIYYNLNDEIIIGNIVYDTIKQNFILAYDRQQLNFLGGSLIDEVGLGKTYQMITVSLCNQAKNINYIQNGYNKLFSKGTLVICPNQLGGQWVREFEKVINEEYNLNVLPLFTKNHFDKYTYQDLLDADFVITTYNFLGNQCFLQPWVSKLSTQKSYITSTKYSHIDCYNTIKKMGIEVKNKSSSIFELNPNPLLIHWHRIVVDEFHEIFTVTKYKYLIRLLQLFEGTYKWCMTATPFDKSTSCLINMMDFITNYKNTIGNNILTNQNIIDHLNKNFFRRNTKQSIINEYQLLPLKENIILLNFSKTEWMMYNAYLANPNVDKFSILVRQICCHPKIADEIKTSLSNCKTLEDIEKMMVKHYENQMLKAFNKFKYIEYRITNTQKKIKMLEWKRQRKFLKQLNFKVKIKFNDNKEKDNIDIQLLEQQLIDDIDLNGLFIGSHNNDDIFSEDSCSDEDDCNKELIIISDDTQDKINKLIGHKLKKDIPISIENLTNIENNFKIKLVSLKNDYDGKKSTYNYYNDVMTRLKKTTDNNDSDSDSDNDSNSDDNNEKCGICMGNIKGHDLGVTKCGHIFCYNCVKPFIEKQLKCPICQKSVKSDEIYMITQPKLEEKNDKEFQDKQSLIGKVGTKLANLIFFLKKNDKHSIIFSQWDDLLKKVGEVLNDYGIKNVFCKGNIWQRDKAIREFNSNDDIKVIMLSSESSASGTNLTKAEMVILLDPIYGSYEYRRNMEWQAIGRAYRMGQTKQVIVIRFIVKNTIEEDIYNMNKGEDKKSNTEMKIFETTDDKIILDKNKINEIVDAVKKIQKKKLEKVPKKVTIKKTKNTKEKKVEEIYNINSDSDSDDSDIDYLSEEED